MKCQEHMKAIYISTKTNVRKKKRKRNSALTLDLERMNTVATGDLLNLQKSHLGGEATLKKTLNLRGKNTKASTHLRENETSDNSW